MILGPCAVIDSDNNDIPILPGITFESLGNKGDLHIYKSRQDTCRLKPGSLNQKFPRLDSMI